MQVTLMLQVTAQGISKDLFLQLGLDLSHMVLIKNYRIKILSVCLVKARSIPREI